MTTLEAIELARKIQQMPDEFEIAKVLIHLEHDAQMRGMSEMAQAAREAIKA